MTKSHAEINDFEGSVQMLKFGCGVAKHRIVILILGILLLVPSFFGYVKTKVNYDILYYLPNDIETMQGQEILLNDFGKGAYVLMVAEGMDDADAARLKDKIENVDHVEEVIWYDTILDDSIPQEMLPEKIYEVFHSDNATLMAVFFDGGTSEESTMEAIDEIRKVGGEQAFFSSMSAIVTDTKHLIEDQLVWYVSIAVILSALVMAVTMDSWIAPILFLINIGMAIVYNMGSNVFRGEISFITMSLAAVLQLAVTMDYSIFLWDSYKEQCEHIEDHTEAMAYAIRDTVASISGSSLTTIAGFIALCFMTFTLGLDMGLVMAKGVVLGVITCVTILPSLIMIFDGAIRKTYHKPVNIKGDRLSKFIVKHRFVIMIIVLVLWIPAIHGYRNIDVYYNLDSSLPDYLPSVSATKELEKNFTMNTIHMVLADDELPDKEVREMLSEMEEVDGVDFAIGGASFIPYSVPPEFIPESMTGALKANGRQLMLISSEYMIASDEVNEQIDELNTILDKYDENAMLIGEAPCTKDLIDITNHDFKVVSAISIIAIFLLIMIVLRSISLPVLLVGIIEEAIFINLGLSYYTHATLPFIASIVISTIQLGATVDYAILMTNRYQIERARGLDKTEAVTKALSSSMASIVTSAVGFFAATVGVGIYSDVDLIGSLCILISRGALISMVIVLVLLPSLLLLFDGVIQKTSFRNYKKLLEGSEGDQV